MCRPQVILSLGWVGLGWFRFGFVALVRVWFGLVGLGLGIQSKCLTGIVE